MHYWKTDPARRVTAQAAYLRETVVKNCFFHPVPGPDFRAWVAQIATKGRDRTYISCSLRKLPADELPFHVSINYTTPEVNYTGSDLAKNSWFGEHPGPVRPNRAALRIAILNPAQWRAAPYC